MDLARAEADRHLAPDPFARSYDGNFGYDPELVLLSGVAIAAAAVGVVVTSAVGAVVDERRDRAALPELPRATARERVAPPLSLEPSRAPEPTPPPSETPRFLK